VNNSTKPNTTLRIDLNTIDYYKSKYNTNHAGCVIAVESFPFLREEALSSLDVKFTKHEWEFIEKAAHGKKMSVEDLTSRRRWEAELGDYYDKINSAITDGKEELTEKFKTIVLLIRGLSPMHRFVIREYLAGKSKEKLDIITK